MNKPSTRRHDLTKQKILETARKLLLTQGMDGLSMRALADAVDYSPAAIYKYFENKEAILQAIRDEGWNLAAGLNPDEDLENLPVIEQLFRSGQWYLHFAETYPEHYLLMFNSPEAGPGGIEQLNADPHFGGLPARIQKGIERGEMRLPEGMTPLMLATLLWTSAHGIAMLKLTVMRDAAREFGGFSEQAMKAFLESLAVK